MPFELVSRLLASGGLHVAFLQLNIRGRLILGFSVLCLLLAGVIGTTIAKVHTVSEATDRTVNLRVPTSMTASDMVTGVYASLASLRGWLITGSKAFKAEPAGVCTEKLKRERSDPPRRAYEVMTPIAEAGEIGASLFKNR